MAKPIEDSGNSAAFRAALDVPTNAELAAKYTKPVGGIPAEDLNADPAGRILLTAPSAAERKAAIGLDQVNNTSDANKPVSTAQALAIAEKMDKTLPALQAVYDGGTAPQKAAFQASVSGGGRRYKLGGRCGLLASPIATATVAGALIFALPESIKIPAGWGGANSRIYYDVRVRRQVAAAAATNVLIRFGPANSNSDQACGLLSLPITLNSDGRAFGSIDAASSTSVSFNSYGAINGSTTAAAQDITAGINFGVDQYINIGISGTNGDQVSLIAYSFYLEV